MSWIAVVMWVISNLPEMIDLIKSIIDLFQSLPKREREERRDMISEAISRAKLTGDKQPVRDLFKKLREERSGVARSPETLQP